jgi:hypothetical protein
MPTIEFMEALLLTLWRMSWQASILVLLVLLAQGLMRHRLSPAWRSALWLLVVARLLLPITPSSPWSLFQLTDRVVARVNSTSDTTTAIIAPSTGVEPPLDWAEPLDDQAWLPPLSMWESRPHPPPLLSPPALAGGCCERSTHGRDTTDRHARTRSRAGHQPAAPQPAPLTAIAKVP